MFDKDNTESELHKFAENYELIKENADFYDVPEKEEKSEAQAEEPTEKSVEDLTEEELEAALTELYEAGVIDAECNILAKFEEQEESTAKKLFDKLSQ